MLFLQRYLQFYADVSFISQTFCLFPLSSGPNAHCCLSHGDEICCYDYYVYQYWCKFEVVNVITILHLLIRNA